MKFFDKLLIKQDFESNINNADFICDKAEETLDTFLDIYLKYCIYQVTSPTEYINADACTLSMYLSQLDTIQKNLDKHMQENPKLLRKYKADYEATKILIDRLHYDIFSLNTDIKKYPSYESINALAKTSKCLSKLESQINQIKGTNADIMVESDRHTVDC